MQHYGVSSESIMKVIKNIEEEARRQMFGVNVSDFCFPFRWGVKTVPYHRERIFQSFLTYYTIIPLSEKNINIFTLHRHMGCRTTPAGSKRRRRKKFLLGHGINCFFKKYFPYQPDGNFIFKKIIIGGGTLPP